MGTVKEHPIQNWGLGAVKISQRKNVRSEGRIRISQNKWPEEGEKKREDRESG